MTVAFNTAVRGAFMDAITSQAGTSAKLLIYTSPRPASGGTPTGTLLATITMASTLAPASSGGVLTLNNAAGAATAAATGTAVWARLETSAGAWVADMDVGSDITVSPTSIQSGAQVTLNNGGTFTAGNA